MHVTVTFKHMGATEALKGHAEERAARLEKFVGSATEVHWVFYLDGAVHVADLRVAGPNLDLFAQSSTPDMYQSIDECVDKLERQLRKRKEIVKDHLHRKRPAASGG